MSLRIAVISGFYCIYRASLYVGETRNSRNLVLISFFPVELPLGALCCANFTLVPGRECFVVVTYARKFFPISQNHLFSHREIFLTPFHKHPHVQDNIPLPRVRITAGAVAPRTIPIVPAAKSGSGGGGEEICRFYPNCSRGGACFYSHPPTRGSKPPPPAPKPAVGRGQRPLTGGSYKWTATRP